MIILLRLNTVIVNVKQFKDLIRIVECSIDDYVEMFGPLYHPTRSSFELSRVSRGQKIIDVRASPSLSEERILTGQSIYVLA